MERGVFELSPDDSRDIENNVARYFLNEKRTELALDVVELVFRVINYFVDQIDNRYAARDQSSTSNMDAVYEQHRNVYTSVFDDLNYRFREHGVGYQFENNNIVRVDSALIHAEAVKPALYVLSSNAFRGPNDEFMRAHEHYRHRRHKECVTDCLKSFESTMKVICSRRQWNYDKDKATASTLIDICFKNGLVPSYLQTEFTSLAALLKSGIPTVRNKRSGHGQGEDVVEVPSYLASYALHMTAANILFLTEADKALR